MRIKSSLFLLTLIISLTSCREEILHVATEAEANKALLSLRNANIDAIRNLKQKKWVISVPQEELTTALSVLEQGSVLQQKRTPIDASGSSSLFKSRREKMIHANVLTAREIEKSLLLVPGVLDSRVHIFQEAQERFSVDTQQLRTASVLLLTKAKKSIDEKSIRSLLAKGAGVLEQHVAIVFIEASASEIPSLKKDAVALVQTEDSLLMGYWKWIAALFFAVILLYFSLVFKKTKPNSHISSAIVEDMY